ncbi:glycerol-3-phosphate dehydrogenase/oxidase [Agriterribacter humi]|uniref:glycerol-3-phosphate dehydrogenase/oxidase n=1 Tax=Agriterribacter humi TaxID=1104781 RepID=UPI001264E0A3|nr:glycerol-3-phosphate dehydrogenase/oxidase [Agriterribacter humi]
MQRGEMLNRLDTETEWDIIIIGGGATGLGTAADAASRGYKTLLLERFDFAKGTSSRATKLVHGGVRYLAQGNIKLVMEALRERGILLRNAPHLTRIQPFILPSYSWWQKWFYGIGLKIYDLMSGKLSIGKTRVLSSKTILQYSPAVAHTKLSGGILYYDGQFDDARLALNLAQTVVEQGGVVLNYMEVFDVRKENGKSKGIYAEDMLTGKEYELKSKVVINATGVFTDDVLQMDDDMQHSIISPSQGIHLVVDKKFFPGDYAMMIPKTDDGRVLFAVPWHGKVIIGTTDTPVAEALFEPRALEEEIEFVFRNVNRYLNSGITRADVKAVFAGLRPLVKAPGQKKTALMPRDHTIIVSKSGLVTITGGKWTTYRKMAKEAVDNALFVGKLERRLSVTESLHIHGWCEQVNSADPLHYYGADAAAVKKLAEENEAWKEQLHPGFPYIKAQVIWAVRNEMAMTVEDVLSRRIRMLFLDARAAMQAAPEVARLMAEEMGKDENWLQDQLQNFTALAEGYLLGM